MSVIEEAESWIKSNPKYARFLPNKELCLKLYSNHHPELKINSDMELKIRDISFGSQTFIAKHDEKLFEFTLNVGLGNYQGNRFGWKGEYAGVNKKGIDHCLDFGYDLKVITPKEEYFFHNSLIKEAVIKKWSMSSNNRPRLFYLPIEYSGKFFSNSKSTKLDDF